MIEVSDSDRSKIATKRWQKFVFVGGSDRKHQFSDRLGNISNIFDRSSILLCNARVNDRLMIVKIQTDRSTRKYLHHLGLRSGTVVRAIGKTSTDSTIVTLGNCQIGLGTAIAQNIVVRLMSCKE